MPHLLPVMDLAELTILPSYECNSADCVGCYKKSVKGYLENQYLDLDVLLRFLTRYLAFLRVHNIGISGGEPTDFCDCIALVDMLTAEFPGVSLEIVTNGQNTETISEIICAAKQSRTLKLLFSIDGYGNDCDHLRGKSGYFDRVSLSIAEMVNNGLGHNVGVNVRYYPEYEESIITLRDYLHEKFGISSAQISMGNVSYLGSQDVCTSAYVSSFRVFADKFWGGRENVNVPNTPSYILRKKPYMKHQRTSFCVPAVQPDGYLYTCDFIHGVRVGHISDDDIPSMIARLVNVSGLNPAQCDNCLYGQCVLNHYVAESKDTPENDTRDT